MADKVIGFPQSSTEYSEWKDQGRTFSTIDNSWYEPLAEEPTGLPEPEQFVPEDGSTIAPIANFGDAGIPTDNIIDADDLINGGVVNAPESLDVSSSNQSSLTNIDTQVAQIKDWALQVQKDLTAKQEADKLVVDEEPSELDKAKEEQQNWLQKMIAGTTDSKEDVRTKAEEEEGLTGKEALLSTQMTKVLATQNQMTVLEDSRQKEIESARERVTAYGNIKGAIQEINRKYDSQKASLAAVLSGEASMASLLSGDVETARGHITEAVNDYMYDYDNEVKRYEHIYDYYSDWVNELTEAQQDTLDKAYDDKKDEQAQAREDLQYKQTLYFNVAGMGGDVPSFSDLVNKTSAEVTDWAGQEVAKMTKQEALLETQKEQEEKRQEEQALQEVEDKETTAEVTASLESANLIDALLNNPSIDRITGALQVPFTLPGTSPRLAETQLQQIKAILSLENRQQLKGQGAISDFEAKMLSESATILDRGLSTDAFKAELRKIKGVFDNSAGKEAEITATSPEGERLDSTASREEINQLLLEGNSIEYR